MIEDYIKSIFNNYINHRNFKLAIASTYNNPSKFTVKLKSKYGSLCALLYNLNIDEIIDDLSIPTIIKLTYAVLHDEYDDIVDLLCIEEIDPRVGNNNLYRAYMDIYEYNIQEIFCGDLNRSIKFIAIIYSGNERSHKILDMIKRCSIRKTWFENQVLIKNFKELNVDEKIYLNIISYMNKIILFR